MADDLDRVLALPVAAPVRRPLTPAAFWAASLGRPGAPILRDVQGAFLDAVVAAGAADGLWGARGPAGLIGCGHGKTLCAQLVPAALGTIGRAPLRPVLLLPAALRTQLRSDVAYWSRWYLLGLADESRWVSYEQLSGPQSQALLTRLAPDLIVMDEAHLLGNPDSARWKRIARYVSTHRECRVVALSGTLAARSLLDMAHILHACLRDWNPLPTDRCLGHLAACVDVGSEPIGDDFVIGDRVVAWADAATPGGPPSDPTVGLMSYIGGTRREVVRRSVFHRLRTAPGVVFASGVAADVSLRIVVESGPPLPPAIDVALAGLRTRWELPDGTELVDAIETHRHHRTLALGFYSRWVPGTVDAGWLEARRTWAREVRRVIEYMPGASDLALDSPALVERAAREGRLDGWAQAAWERWAVVKQSPRQIRAQAWGQWRPSGKRVEAPAHPYREWLEPPTETVWLEGGTGYLHAVYDTLCAPWPSGARGTRGGGVSSYPPGPAAPESHGTQALGIGGGGGRSPCVVWVGSPTVGGVISGLQGKPYHGAGSQAPGAPNGAEVVIASHRVHGKGWNGQAWPRAVILEPPDGPEAWEQLLARHHRPGAAQDVEVVILAGTPEARVGIRAARAAARFAQETLGTPQRLLLADWQGWDRSDG